MTFAIRHIRVNLDKVTRFTFFRKGNHIEFDGKQSRPTFPKRRRNPFTEASVVGPRVILPTGLDRTSKQFDEAGDIHPGTASSIIGPHSSGPRFQGESLESE